MTARLSCCRSSAEAAVTATRNHLLYRMVPLRGGQCAEHAPAYPRWAPHHLPSAPPAKDAPDAGPRSMLPRCYAGEAAAVCSSIRGAGMLESPLERVRMRAGSAVDTGSASAKTVPSSGVLLSIVSLPPCPSAS